MYKDMWGGLSNLTMFDSSPVEQQRSSLHRQAKHCPCSHGISCTKQLAIHRRRCSWIATADNHGFPHPQRSNNPASFSQHYQRQGLGGLRSIVSYHCRVAFQARESLIHHWHLVKLCEERCKRLHGRRSSFYWWRLEAKDFADWFRALEQRNTGI